VISDDVERLTGRRARSVRQMIADNLEMLRNA
jgi:NAD(P)H dehydrogenase (quinone)